MTGLSACKTVNTVERAEPIGQATPVMDRRIETDGGLSKIARIVDVREATVSGDILKVQVDLLNTRSSAKRFNYKFDWYDLEGMRVDTALSTWQPQQIQGKEVITLTGIAPTPRAKDFKLKLQESRGK